MKIATTLCNDTLSVEASTLLQESILDNGQRIHGPGMLVVANPTLRAPWISGYTPADVMETGLGILRSFEADVPKKISDAISKFGFCLAGSLCWRPGPKLKDQDVTSTEVVVVVDPFEAMTSMPWLFAWSMLHEIVCTIAEVPVGPMVIMTPMLRGAEDQVTMIDVPEEFVHPYHAPEYRKHTAAFLKEDSLDQFLSDLGMFTSGDPAIGYRHRFFQKVALPVRNLEAAAKARDFSRGHQLLADIKSPDWAFACESYLIDMEAAVAALDD